MLLRRLTIASLLFALAGCGHSPFDLDGGGGTGEGGDDATGSGAGANEGGSGAGSGEGGSIPATEDPYEPAPTPTPFTDAELEDLQNDVDDALASASASYSAIIVGLDTGQIVYEKNPNTLKKPASNTKLFTTAAALALEGEAGRPAVGVYGSLSGGTVQGDIVLLAEHDPSTTPWFADGSRQPLDAIADVLAASGITNVTGGVVAKGEFLYEGNSLGTIDFGAERSQAANAFRSALVAAGISVAGGATTATGFDAPGGSTLLLDVPSASHDVVAHAINVPSHNEMADLLMHHLGTLGGGPSTYAGGFDTIASVLDDLGVAHEGFDLNDGSGLSHDNRVSARQIADLFVAMSATAEWPAYVGSMAVSGVRGTIGSRMTGDNTWGRFWGKTGTLTGVIALSGVLFHRHDGQRYVASFLANDVGNATAARAAVDAAVGALAADRKVESGVPDTPSLDRLADDGNGETALVELGEVDGATGYLIWRSSDGRTWSRDEARLVTKTTHRTFTFDGALFVRVSAVNAVGESTPSNVLGVRVTGAGPRTLFVDAYDRYVNAPVGENPLGWGNDAVVAHAAAITGRFESASHFAIESGQIDLTTYDVVVWGLGREGTTDETFTAGEQEKVRTFVDDGGRLFVSGAEVAYDLVDQGSAADVAFASEVLGIGYVADDAATTFLASGDVDAGITLARFSKLGRHEIAFADVLSPAGGGSSCLRYAAGAGGDACVLTDTTSGGRVVVLGFPLESLDDPTAGAALLALLGP